MKAKPGGLGPEYGAQFADPAVVSAYRHRPPYPQEAIDCLLGLTRDRHRLLDVGCGRGNLTIPLAPHFDEVDAVDPSDGMIDQALKLAGEECAHIRWHRARLCDAGITGPYSLITAGESLHWTDWDVDLPRLGSVLEPTARLAIVIREYGPTSWQAEARELRVKHSTNREFTRYDLIEELASRGLFVPEGRIETARGTLTESADVFIEAQHSANGFSRDRMTPEAALRFDEALRALIPEIVTTPYWVRIEYGRPCP